MTASPILEVDRGNSPSRDLDPSTCAATAPSAAAGQLYDTANGLAIGDDGWRERLSGLLSACARNAVLGSGQSITINMPNELARDLAASEAQHRAAATRIASLVAQVERCENCELRFHDEQQAAKASMTSEEPPLTNEVSQETHAPQVPGDKSREENHD